MRILVVGAGSWGTTLACLLARKNYIVTIWARDQILAQRMQILRYNPRYQSEAFLPPNLVATSDLSQAAAHENDVAVFAVPSHAMRTTVQKVRSRLNPDTLVISVAKGIEEKTFKRMSEVLVEELSSAYHKNIAVLSGPNHAEEVSREIPTATVISAFDKKVAKKLQDIFMTPCFRVYTNPDMIGVELAGAVKNIIAIAAGISDGLGFGDNTKASLITRGLAEMTRFGVALGAKAPTFSGLAGMGDLIVTCISRYSRNRAVGEKLGRGEKLEDILKETSMVAEGIRTSRAVYELANNHRVPMPITKNVTEVLYEGKNPRESVKELMTREATEEIEEIVLP